MTLLQLWEKAVYAASGRSYLSAKRCWGQDGTLSSVLLRVNNGYTVLAVPAPEDSAVWFVRSPVGKTMGSRVGSFEQLMEDVNDLYALA